MLQLLKPRFRDFFETDIMHNVRSRSDDFSIPVNETDLIEECVMYAVDMCIEFQKKSDGLLSDDWIEHISNEVCSVFRKNFPTDFGITEVNDAKSRIRVLMQTPSQASTEVSIYYNRI